MERKNKKILINTVIILVLLAGFTWVGETQTAHLAEGMKVRISVDAIPGVTYEGRVQALSQATGAQYSLVPQDNSAGNFVKVEQRVPVKIVFTDANRAADLQRLRSGLNVECETAY